jgi:outer membrane protein OmpA-like peptidoglycan-associated protein
MLRLLAIAIMVFGGACALKLPPRSYWPDGTLKSAGNYSSAIGYKKEPGKKPVAERYKRGKWIFYYENGQKAQEVSYQRKKDGNNRPAGTWNWHDSTGVLLKTERYRKRGAEAGTQTFSAYVHEGVFSWEGERWDITRTGKDSFQISISRDGTPYRTYLQYGGILSMRTTLSKPGQQEQGDEAFLGISDAPFHNPDILADSNWNLPETLNLVHNPSFEHTREQWPEMTYTSFDDTMVHHWVAASGTPDFYRGKKARHRSGTASLGIRIYSRSGAHIEYLTGALKAPLQADSIYCVKVHFILSRKSALAADAVGFSFSSTPLNFYRFEASGLQPNLVNRAGQVLFYREQWMQLSGAYKATGGEGYFNIGGFRPLDSIHVARVNSKGQKEAYYFIDDVAVWPAQNGSCASNTWQIPPAPMSPPDTGRMEPSYILEEVFFQSNSATLEADKLEQLDDLAAWMNTHPDLNLRISGHTDSTGNEEKNRQLSLQRAEAVLRYLERAGVQASRMEALGRGSAEPIAPNDTPEQRRRNRRVEVQFMGSGKP